MRKRPARLVALLLLIAAPLAAQTPAPPGAPPAPPVGTSPPPEPAGPAAVPPPAPPTPDRIKFEVKFPPERGGGKAVGTAGAVEYQRDEMVVASGGVEFTYQDYKVTAQRIEVDQPRQLLTATGGVVLDQGPRRLSGKTLAFDLETKTGSLSAAEAFVAPDYYFRGEEIAKVGDDLYSVEDGVFTSCSGDNPDWSFRLDRARVEVEGYARVHHARIRVKRLPIFYIPYLLWPAKRERSSGLLIPNVGYTRRRGGYLGLAYFQALGRSYDTTLFVDLYSNEYYGLGDEFRYHPTEGTKGVFRGYLIDDPVGGETRWKVEYDHETADLPGRMRGVVAYRDFSDFEFFRDFERGINENSLRTLYSSGFVTGNWGPQSFNFLVDDRRTFIEVGRVVRQRQLPEAEYRLRPTRLGGLPLYLQMLSSATYLSVERSDTFQGEYGRADLFPQLSLPLRSVPWLSLSLNAGGRATWYADSLCRRDTDGVPEAGECEDGVLTFSGESLTRAFPTAGAEIVGPSLSRIFDGGGAFAKFKHVVEPRWTYSFLGEFDDRDLVPLFDEVDTPNATNVGRVALVNRLLAKPADAKQGGAREILSLEIGQAYSFDETQPLQFSRDRVTTDPWGPLTGLLRFQPTTGTNLKAQVAYNTLFDEVESTALSGALAVRRNNLGVTWFTRRQAESGETTADQLGVFAGIAVVPGRLRLEGQVNYDLQTSFLQQQRLVADYTSQCFGVRFEFREFRAVDRRDRDYRFALTLKNVGTFLDLTGGRSESF